MSPPPRSESDADGQAVDVRERPRVGRWRARVARSRRPRRARRATATPVSISEPCRWIRPVRTSPSGVEGLARTSQRRHAWVPVASTAPPADDTRTGCVPTVRSRSLSSARRVEPVPDAVGAKQRRAGRRRLPSRSSPVDDPGRVRRRRPSPGRRRRRPRRRSPWRAGSTPASSSATRGSRPGPAASPALLSRATQGVGAPARGLPARRTASNSTDRVAPKRALDGHPVGQRSALGATTSGTMPASEIAGARSSTPARSPSGSTTIPMTRPSVGQVLAELGQGGAGLEVDEGLGRRPVRAGRDRRRPARTGRGRCSPARAAGAP